MSGHVIVVGLGAFGLQVAARLQSVGKQVVVIEHDERNRFLSEAATLDLPIIFGDATSAVTLESARLRHAAAIAILTSNDMVNIETGIAVRDMLGDEWTAGSLPVVMRVFDQSLSRTISARFGFQNIQSIEEITAPWFVAAALGLEVLGAFSVAQQPFTIGRLTIAADSALVGVAMQGLSANTRVIALHRRATGVLEHPPRRASIFEEGDMAYIVGPNDELIGVLRTATAPPSPAHPPADRPPADRPPADRPTAGQPTAVRDPTRKRRRPRRLKELRPFRSEKSDEIPSLDSGAGGSPRSRRDRWHRCMLADRQLSIGRDDSYHDSHRRGRRHPAAGRDRPAVAAAQRVGRRRRLQPKPAVGARHGRPPRPDRDQRAGRPRGHQPDHAVAHRRQAQRRRA